MKILLDVPSLRQDAERDKRTTSLGVVDDAGHVVHVSGQLVAIRAAKNALPSVPQALPGSVVLIVSRPLRAVKIFSPSPRSP